MSRGTPFDLWEPKTTYQKRIYSRFRLDGLPPVIAKEKCLEELVKQAFSACLHGKEEPTIVFGTLSMIGSRIFLTVEVTLPIHHGSLYFVASCETQDLPWDEMEAGAKNLQARRMGSQGPIEFVEDSWD